jgi:hypothetical protein
VVHGLGEGVPAQQQLDADINVVPAFMSLRREGPGAWVPVLELPVGDLTENTASTQEFFLASSTRRQMAYTIAVEPPEPCVEVTSAVPATPDEWASLNAFLRTGGARPGEEAKAGLRPPKSLYKVRVTVRERCAVPGQAGPRQLDLGPLDQRLRVSAADGGSVPMLLRGRVHGQVVIRSGAVDGRIDLGNFATSEDSVKDVILSADRPGLDLSLVPNETRPNYLKVRLDPIDPVDGRKQWRLKVTIPRGARPGSLPDGSGVTLQTNDPTPRRLRLPVRGMTYDSGGGPRL